jgi:hypothetical protein
VRLERSNNKRKIASFDSYSGAIPGSGGRGLANEELQQEDGAEGIDISRFHDFQVVPRRRAARRFSRFDTMVAT